MLLDQKSRLMEDLERRYKLYLILCYYYQGKLWMLEHWDEVFTRFNSLAAEYPHPAFDEGLQLLAQASPDAMSEALYDYNRLFVGPGKLLAPPYEGAYRNPEGLLMQQETLAVRWFYQKAGLAVRRKGSEPDDHLGLELEFVCYLFSRAAQSLTRDDSEGYYRYMELYEVFLKKHLIQWVFQHVTDVLCHGTTPICRAMALLLRGFIHSEKERLIFAKEGSAIG